MIDLTHSEKELLLTDINRIANALETLASAIEGETKVLKMKDVERAQVYATHLGEKLKPKEI